MSRRWEDDVRRIAALLARDTTPGGGPAVLVFTSPARRVGVTTIVWKAAEFMQTVYGRRVLIIELNARKPRLARLLHLDPHKGLLATAAGDPLPQQIQTTKSGVSVLAIGQMDDPAAHRPDLQRLAMSVIDAVGANYDFILIDTPPLTDDPDALALAAAIGKVAIVLRAAGTSVQAVLRMTQELARPDGSSPVVLHVLNRYRPIMPEWIDRWLSQ